MSFASGIHPAYDVYAQELWSLGHGHAMWGPEPSPAFGEVRLGDVGYPREGHFSFLFNCMCDAHDPVNKRGVAGDFEVFAPPDANSIQHCPDKITQSELHSKNIRSLAVSVGASVSETITTATAAATLRYQCTQTSGALLLLKENAHKWFLDCDRHIKAYMSAHIEQWHEFATMRLGIDVKQEDIIFVSGCTKTSVWAEAAFHGTSSQGELVVSGGWPVPAVAGEFRVSLSRSADASVFSRIGPSHRVQKTNSSETVAFDIESDTVSADQCIFINYHKAKQRKRWRPLKVMKAAAGPQDPGSSSDGDDPFVLSVPGSPVASETSNSSSSTLSETGCSYISFSPVDSLIDHIFMNSDAAVACVSDTDLTNIFASKDLPKDIHHALELLWSSTIIRDCADVRLQDRTLVVPADFRLFRFKSISRVISPATSVDSSVGTLVDLELPNWLTDCEPKVAPFWVEPASTLDSSQLLPNDFVDENADAPIPQVVSSYLEAVMSSHHLPAVLFGCPSDDAVGGNPRDDFDERGYPAGLHPVGLEDQNVKPADGSGDVKPALSEQDAIEAKQMQNTLAACSSRKRDPDDQQDLATTIEEEVEMRTQRAMRLRTLSGRQGQPVHKGALRMPVEREKEEIDTWRQQAMESQLWLESQGFGHESEASSSELA